MHKYFITGGAGFIGSHLTKFLLKNNTVTVYDNFCSGTKKHLKSVLNNKKLKIITGDLKNLKRLKQKIKNHDFVIHCAANPDIAKAAYFPDVDFWEGTYLTQNLLEAMRINKIKNIIYMSGSGVYGENNKNVFTENYSPKNPISTYGASKLACEALISSYSNMFFMNALIFRFANVVGSYQTHGVGYDFIKKIRQNNKKIKILGNGKQKKSYIYISDVINAIVISIKKTKLYKKKKIYQIFNVGTNDSITVNEILKITLSEMKIKKIKINKDKSLRGWSGDVPIIKLICKNIKKLGWKPKFNSNQAIHNSIKEMIKYT